MGWFRRLRAPDDESSAAGGPRLLLSTFGRMLWYFPATDTHRPFHQGRGKYYGVAATGPDEEGLRRLLVVSRPDQDRDDRLLVVDHVAGKTVRKIPLASRDTHQAVRHRDELWVTDTFRGNVLVYSLPRLELVRTYDPFTHENHVNSLLVEDRSFFALCHNKGKSFMAQVDRGTGEVTGTYPDVGEHSHDVVPWEGSFLICDSRGGGLVRVDRETRECRTLYADPGHFTKGLAVDEGVAYFGISPAAKREERIAVDCDLVAYDLGRDELIWRRRLSTGGLVNAITTPAKLVAAVREPAR